jgi:N-hydroxyarylamine O-acetyltransferase
VVLDLDAYLARIDHRGPLDPTRETLSALLLLHMTRIPFENLDVLLGRTPRLDLEALQDKLVTARRGGYCYEHATLFAAVLEHLGFRLALHSARVTGASPKATTPRTHMLLTVALPSGTVMIDPGFGGIAPRVPVTLDGAVARHALDEHWLARDGEDFILRARVPVRGEVTCWVSTLAPDFPIDFEMANHFTATWPRSPFTQRLVLRAFTPDGRITIMNRDVTTCRGDTAETRPLVDRADLRALLVQYFGFDLPDVSELRVPSLPDW